MKEVLLIKNGELALKGLNRSTFEDILVKNMKRRLAATVGKFYFTKSQSTIVAEAADEDADFEAAVDVLGKVFGIAAFSRAAVCEKDFESIKNTALEYLGDDLRQVKTFKVNAKRSDKRFPMTSPEICREVGAHLLRNIHTLHRARVNFRVPHTGGQGAGGGVEVLHLLGLTACFVEKYRQIHRVIQRTAGVAAHQIGNQILLHAVLLV